LATVTLKNICKSYHGAAALSVDDVSFTVNDGEFMVLLGPSGCGKSTTLRKIAGLESITRGKMELDGKAGEVTARLHRDTSVHIGEAVGLQCAPEAIYLFDAVTEKAIVANDH
jgi:multiple sugar transport system ATP-binding protein